jgi:cyanuric acid amidohydrolase
MRAPDDVSALTEAFAKGDIDKKSVVAIFANTEGNGLVNDFTRALANRALKDALGDADASLVMSGGTEGGLSPHCLVLEVREVDETARAGALAIGCARTHDLPYESLGRLAQVHQVAAGVVAAMADAGIERPDQVHFVQIKCPLLTTDRVVEAEARGSELATRDTMKSMALSRAASSLGVAVALGEILREDLGESAIGRDWSLYSSRASASAGVELMHHEIVVLGVAPNWCGPLTIEHCVMQDAIDIEPVRGALARVGLGSPGQFSATRRGKLVALLAKAEASSTGSLRGYRHTMLNDSDIASTRHARGFVAGALAALVGHAEIYVSGGAEHQGPDGGGPVAVIAHTGGTA